MEEQRKINWTINITPELAGLIEELLKLESERVSITLSRNQFVLSLIRRGIETLGKDG